MGGTRRAPWYNRSGTPRAREEVRQVKLFDRIAVDPKVCGGKPCTRYLRYPVSRLPGLLGAGETRESILQGYP